MKQKKLPVGIEFFEDIQTQGFYYADKTGFITELLRNWGKVHSITDFRYDEYFGFTDEDVRAL